LAPPLHLFPRENLGLVGCRPTTFKIVRYPVNTSFQPYLAILQTRACGVVFCETMIVTDRLQSKEASSRSSRECQLHTVSVSTSSDRRSDMMSILQSSLTSSTDALTCCHWLVLVVVSSVIVLFFCDVDARSVFTSFGAGDGGADKKQSWVYSLLRDGAGTHQDWKELRKTQARVKRLRDDAPLSVTVMTMMRAIKRTNKAES